MRRAGVAMGLAVALGVAGPAAAAPFTNGSFEFPDTPTPAVGTIAQLPANTGTQVVDMEAGVSRAVTLCQTFDTTAGQHVRDRLRPGQQPRGASRPPKS